MKGTTAVNKNDESPDDSRPSPYRWVIYFFGFLGGLVCPPLFGLLVDTTERYGYAWFLPAFCATAILLFLNFYKEDKAPVVGR